MTTASPRGPQTTLRSWLDARDARYEVVDGTVLVSPPDRFAHAERVPLIAAALLAAAPPELVVLGPSYAVLYDPDQPDVFVLPDVLVARREDCGERGTRAAPLLVVEVLSPSTRRRDRGEKRELYAQLGVPAYWLVDPERHTATVLRLDGAGHVEGQTAVRELQVDWPYAVRVPL